MKGGGQADGAQKGSDGRARRKIGGRVVAGAGRRVTGGWQVVGHNGCGKTFALQRLNVVLLYLTKLLSGSAVGENLEKEFCYLVMIYRTEMLLRM